MKYRNLSLHIVRCRVYDLNRRIYLYIYVNCTYMYTLSILSILSTGYSK